MIPQFTEIVNTFIQYLPIKAVELDSTDNVLK